MNLDELYVHDGRLRRVVEECGAQTLLLEVDLPANEWSDELEPKRILLREVYGYTVEGGPFEGTPAIF